MYYVHVIVLVLHYVQFQFLMYLCTGDGGGAPDLLTHEFWPGTNPVYDK